MNASDVVILRSGLTVPLAAVRLALDLEERGINLMREDDDVLAVGPRERLTDEDRVAIRKWKLPLLAIVTYAATEAQRGPQ